MGCLKFPITKNIQEAQKKAKNYIEYIRNKDFQLVDIWTRWPARKFLVSRFYHFKNIKNYYLGKKKKKKNLKCLYLGTCKNHGIWWPKQPRWNQKGFRYHCKWVKIN